MNICENTSKAKHSFETFKLYGILVTFCLANQHMPIKLNIRYFIKAQFLF